MPLSRLFFAMMLLLNGALRSSSSTCLTTSSMAPMLAPECEPSRTSNIKEKTHRLIRLLPDTNEIVSSSNRLIMSFLEPQHQMGKGGKKNNSILGNDEKEKEKKGNEKINRYHTIFTSWFVSS